MLIYKL